MRKSETEQILEEICDIIAAERGLDSRIIQSIITHQFSFTAKAIADFKNIRLYKFGIFYLKTRFREMLNDVGYVKYFRGFYPKYKQQFLSGEGEEHREGMEESNMEESGDRGSGEGEEREVCKLSEVK